MSDSKLLSWISTLQVGSTPPIASGSEPGDPLEARKQYLLTHPPTTKAELREVLETLLGGEFKTGIVMSEAAAEPGHMPPLDWMWHAWCLAWNRSADGQWRPLGRQDRVPQRSLLLHGPRGGMKTLAMAAFWFLICWYIPGYTYSHTAAEKAQSGFFIDYLHLWAKSDTFKAGMKEAFSLKVTFANRSQIYILTASMRGLNAPHTLSIGIDEVEIMEQALLQQALQIPQDQPGFDFPSLIMLASTQKRANWGMSQLIKSSVKEGRYKYIIWNSFDVVEACPAWRREKIEERGLKCSDWAVLAAQRAQLELKAESEVLSVMEEETLKALTLKMNMLLSNCKLAMDCRGLAVGGTGHLSIETLLQRINNLDRATWEAENLCKRPSTEGAVYTQLSEENLSEDAIYRPDEGRVIAGIDYGFIDKAVIVIALEHRIFVDVFYEEAHEGYYQEDLLPITKALANRFRVEKWIVASDAKELIRGMRKAGLPVVRSSRKSKLAGCDHVASLICDGTGLRRLRFHPVDAYMTYEQMESYQRKNNSAEPKDGDDDHCLVAGTMITTDRGDVSVDQIIAGNSVLTRQGYKPVLASCKTNESADVMTAHFSNGTCITGTPNHPVYVLGLGYIALRALRYNDACLSVQLHQSTPSFIAASPSADTQRARGSVIADITSQALATLSAASWRCIRRFGRTHMDRSRTVFKSTIGTSTRLTMLSRIWSAFPVKSTAHCTKPCSPTNNGSSAMTDWLPRRWKWLLSGMAQTLAGRFTAHWASGVGKLRLALNATASIAESPMLRGAECTGASVPMAANRLGAELPVPTTSREPALSAGLNSPAIDIQASKPAPVHVLRVVREPRKQPVYNLSVDANPGEYFANGILTHNCDAVRYLCEDVKIRRDSTARIITLPRRIGRTLGVNRGGQRLSPNAGAGRFKR
jgi:hypothetical protein